MEHERTLPFHGQDEREEFQFAFHQHWVRLFWPFLRTLLITLGSCMGGWLILFREGVADAGARHGILIGLTILLLITHWTFLMRLYVYYLYVIVVTDRRIHRVKKTLLSEDDHQTVDIWTLQDINKSQHGIIQMILGYGTILLESQDTKLRLHFIPRINEMYRKIAHVREVARERYMPSPTSRIHTR